MQKICLRSFRNCLHYTVCVRPLISLFFSLQMSYSVHTVEWSQFFKLLKKCKISNIDARIGLENPVLDRLHSEGNPRESAAYALIIYMKISLPHCPCTDEVDWTHVYVCAVLFCPTERDTAQSKDDDQEDDCEWTITLQPHAEGVDAVVAPPQALSLDPGPQSATGCPSPEGSTQADSSNLPSSAPQVTTHAHPTEVALPALCFDLF